jgi:predicted small integral membrane protein
MSHAKTLDWPASGWWSSGYRRHLTASGLRVVRSETQPSETASKPGAAGEREIMTLRLAKTLLVFAVAIFYSLVVLNNTTDYNSNYQFVRHVLMMDSTRPGNGGMWRALNSPGWHVSFYISIIAWEAVTMILCWWGGVRLAQVLRGTAEIFNQAKRVAIVALTCALLMWLVAFLTVGGEWFLMWQSKTWNGQDAAFRVFTVIGLVLLLLAQPDREGQP